MRFEFDPNIFMHKNSVYLFSCHVQFKQNHLSYMTIFAEVARIFLQITKLKSEFKLLQILAYLLISSSSAAASRNDVWVSRFGGDDFTKMVNVSVAMSFLAFFAVALSSVISAYNLFSWNL